MKIGGRLIDVLTGFRFCEISNKFQLKKNVNDNEQENLSLLQNGSLNWNGINFTDENLI